MEKLKVAFVCIHNSCRSQMAEGFGKTLLTDYFDVYSAGTEDYPQVKQGAVDVMKEIDIDLSEQYPKLLSDIPEKLDLLITMGCGVECPFVPTRFREDWGLVDPSGGPIEGFRNTRDIIKSKVEELLVRYHNGEFN
jgi:arsenate reductase